MNTISICLSSILTIQFCSVARIAFQSINQLLISFHREGVINFRNRLTKWNFDFNLLGCTYDHILLWNILFWEGSRSYITYNIQTKVNVHIPILRAYIFVKRIIIFACYRPLGSGGAGGAAAPPEIVQGVLSTPCKLFLLCYYTLIMMNNYVFFARHVYNFFPMF